MQVPLVTFSPRAQAAAIQASAQAGQPNGTGQAGHQTATLNPGSLRLDPLGRPMSIDHEHQVCVSMLPGFPHYHNNAFPGWHWALSVAPYWACMICLQRVTAAQGAHLSVAGVVGGDSKGLVWGAHAASAAGWPGPRQHGAARWPHAARRARPQPHAWRPASPANPDRCCHC